MLDALVAERTQMIDMLARLSPQEWELTSACEGWSVAQLTAHVVIGDGIPWGLPGAMVTRSLDRWMDGKIQGVLRRGTGGMVETLRRKRLPTFARLGSMGRSLMYIETLVHYEDMRRPLGKPRSAPPDQELTWSLVPSFAAGQLKRLKTGGRLLLNGEGAGGVVLEVLPSSKARPSEVGAQPDAALRGDPAELLLFFAGRACDVSIEGDCPLGEALRTAAFRV